MNAESLDALNEVSETVDDFHVARDGLQAEVSQVLELWLMRPKSTREGDPQATSDLPALVAAPAFERAPSDETYGSQTTTLRHLHPQIDRT